MEGAHNQDDKHVREVNLVTEAAEGLQPSGAFERPCGHGTHLKVKSKHQSSSRQREHEKDALADEVGKIIFKPKNHEHPGSAHKLERSAQPSAIRSKVRIKTRGDDGSQHARGDS